MIQDLRIEEVLYEAVTVLDPPPLNWSTLRVGMSCKEDRDREEALQIFSHRWRSARSLQAKRHRPSWHTSSRSNGRTVRGWPPALPVPAA